MALSNALSMYVYSSFYSSQPLVFVHPALSPPGSFQFHLSFLCSVSTNPVSVQVKHDLCIDEPCKESSIHVHTNGIPLQPSPFSPPLMLHWEMLQIIGEWADAISMDILSELSCGCCGRLSSVCNIHYLNINDSLLTLLRSPIVLSVDRCIDSPVLCTAGVIMKDGTKRISLCMTYRNAVVRKRMSSLALANGLWLDKVLNQLQNLNFMKKLLVAYYWHNVCIVRVAHGQCKLSGNTVVFSQPVMKFCDILLPPPKEIDDCLMILFTGFWELNYDDFKRTPLLVR